MRVIHRLGVLELGQAQPSTVLQGGEADLTIANTREEGEGAAAAAEAAAGKKRVRLAMPELRRQGRVRSSWCVLVGTVRLA